MRSLTRGFTLAELLTCLAVMGVVLGIGVPMFAGLREQVAAVNT